MPLDLLHICLHNRLHMDQPGGSTAMGITKRGATFYLRRRRPKRYESVEPRGTVWISLHTDSETMAKSKADRAWAQMIEAWEARLAGDTEDAEARFAAAQELARVRGMRYLDVGRVARLPVESLVERVEAIAAPVEAAALLGTVPEPEMTVTKALESYWTLAREKTLGKSADQLRRWRNPRIGAWRRFGSVPCVAQQSEFSSGCSAPSEVLAKGILVNPPTGGVP